MDVTNVEIQKNENYQIDFDNNGGHQKIKATDVNDFICTNTADWISFSQNGNELEIIVLPNKYDTERTTDIYLKSKYYYNCYATILISQSETVYSIEVTNGVEIKDKTAYIKGLKVYNGGNIETKTATVQVEGATKRCIVKGIRQYIVEDEDETYMTTFDNAINAKLIQTKTDGIYTLQLTNYGKVTSGKTYYKLTLCHKDNIDTEYSIIIEYEEETDVKTKFIINNTPTNVVSLNFDYSGYCANSIIKLFTTEETVSFTTTVDWLYCRLGFDCIKVFADYNENNNDRNGTITVGNDCTISVTQAKKEEKTTSYDDEIAVASNELEEDFIIDQTPAIELLDITDNTVECKTYIYNHNTDEYDNDSQISVITSGIWLHYSTSYDIEKKTHIITFRANENKWLTDRKCRITITNVEDNYEPIVLIATQSFREDILKFERLTVD